MRKQPFSSLDTFLCYDKFNETRLSKTLNLMTTNLYGLATDLPIVKYNTSYVPENYMKREHINSLHLLIKIDVSTTVFLHFFTFLLNSLNLLKAKKRQ